jgi:hypothetical protein
VTPLAVQVRLYVAGVLVDDVPVMVTGHMGPLLGSLGDQHATRCRAASDAGLPWMIELAFPDGDHVRWGTDADGMVQPIEATLDQLERVMRQQGRL